MNYEYLRTLLDYHYWARDRTLAASALLSAEQYARPLGSSFPSIQDTLNHTYSAEWVWHARWNGESPMVAKGKDELPDIAALSARWSELESNLRGFLESIGPDGLERRFDYTTFNGKPGNSAFWEMLAHVVNHATYHRGQVTTMLRQLGAKPAEPTDMIAFLRMRQVS